jgi:glycosyltransferase involved in cell wall biosynthesis
LADLLDKAGFGVGFVLYDRDEISSFPTVYETAVLSRYPASVVRYNVRMPDSGLLKAFREAIMAASRSYLHAELPIVYLQTDAILSFVPPEFKVIITHHSPFVDGVCEGIGESSARRAFEWDHPKMDFLRSMQRRGLSIVRTRSNVRCLEISSLQETFLRQSLISEEQIFRIPPPVGGHVQHNLLPRELVDAVNEASRTQVLTAVTVVSRFDFFKNIDLFVDACVGGMRRGIVGMAIIVGGDEVDVERERLFASVPHALQPRFVFTKRLARSSIVGGLFPALVDSGVFVCTSRYDLVPYTVLEASSSGLCTFVPDSELVGAREYIPRRYRFRPDVEGLVSLLQTAFDDQNFRRAFRPTAQKIRSMVSDQMVMSEFGRLWSSMLLGHGRPLDLPRA